MANQTSSAAKGAPMSLGEVREAIKRGDFKMEDLMSSLADEKIYVRVGGNYRELHKDGVSVVNGQFANCYKLSDTLINADGETQAKRSRKKKSA